MPEKTLDFDFLDFYDDGNALTLNLSDKTYVGVVLDEGVGVTFGSDKFLD